MNGRLHEFLFPGPLSNKLRDTVSILNALLVELAARDGYQVEVVVVPGGPGVGQAKSGAGVAVMDVVTMEPMRPWQVVVNVTERLT